VWKVKQSAAGRIVNIERPRLFGGIQVGAEAEQLGWVGWCRLLFADPLAYERASVSVPFGNCTEPSNVKAGGGACPIRFQCAGYGFYRPDHLVSSALEEHIHSLKADRETRAMRAADYVIANMSTEIDAFTRVVLTMRRRLAELGAEQRAEVEKSSRILRRARAARRIPRTSARETG
jgi:hypothetical protein